MDAKLFESCVPLYFDHFLQTYGFYIPGKYSLSGRLYDAVFEKHNKTLSISWEPGDGCLEIILFQKDGRKLSDYDDRSQTKSLSDLNSEYSVGKTNSDINEIDIDLFYFKSIFDNL